MLQARRWLPGRQLVVVGDSGFAALELLAALSRRGVACITRLRLEAALYDPAPPRLPGTPTDDPGPSPLGDPTAKQPVAEPPEGASA